MEQQHKRSAFSGKIGFVLSAAGASVGLGNIWLRFSLIHTCSKKFEHSKHSLLQQEYGYVLF